MHRIFTSFLNNILNALYFEGIALAVMQITVNRPETTAYVFSLVFFVLDILFIIALKATCSIGVALWATLPNSPSPLSLAFSPVSQNIKDYFTSVSSSTGYAFKVALGNNWRQLSKWGQPVSMAVVQFKSMYPQARRTLLLLTYKPAEVEMTSAMNKKSSLEDTPAVPSLSKGKLVEVEKPVNKSHEMRRQLLLTYRPLLLLTYKPVSEVKETSAAQKLSSGRKPLLLLTYEPIEVEKAKTTSAQPSTDSRSTPLLLTYKTVEVFETSTTEKDSPAEPSFLSPVANDYADVVSETQCPGQTPGTPPVPATPELQLLELGQPPESPTTTQTEGGLDLDFVESELAEESEEGRVEVFDKDVDALAEAFSVISLGCESQSIDWEVSAEEIDSLVEAFSAVTLGHEGESATVVVANASVTLDLPTDMVDIEEAELGAVVVYKDPSWVLGKRKAENEADSLYNRRFSKSVMVWENSSVASGFPKFYQRTTTSSKVPYRCLGDFRQRKGRSAFDQVDDERRRNAAIKAERAARISAALLNDVEMGSCDGSEYAGEPMELDF